MLYFVLLLYQVTHSNCSSVSNFLYVLLIITTLIFIYDCFDCSLLFCRIAITCLCSRVDRKYYFLSNQYYYIICYMLFMDQNVAFILNGTT